MPAAVPAWQVQVAWTGKLTGVMTLGTSQIGGPDVLGGSFGGTTFDTLPDVKSFQIQRGRSSGRGTIQQGQCTLVLRDPSGTYNPSNPGSALAGALVPMRPLRVRATWSGTTYGLFSGFISTIAYNPDPKRQETTIQAVDFFEWLNYAQPTIGSLGATTTGTAIGKILDAVGWTDPTMRSLDAGDAIPDFSADGSKTALVLIEDLLAPELGQFFVDGDGVSTYRSRASRFSNSAAVASFPSSMVLGAQPGTDVRNLVNKQVVTRTGGVAQIAEDLPSEHAYASRVGSPITTDYLMSDTAANSLANAIVTLSKDPRPPTRQVVIQNGSAANLVQQLSRELGDVVTVSTPDGGSATGPIDAIQHRGLHAGLVLQTAFLVSKRAASFFTIGVDTLGDASVLGY